MYDMPTPLWSYRIPRQHRAVMRRVADALKRDPTLAKSFRALAEQRTTATNAIGRFRDEDAALGFIRDRLLLSLKPEAIWLFGSRARGEQRVDSDFDVLVVLPDELLLKTQDYRYVLEPVLGSGLPCDVVPCSASDFAAARDAVGTLAYEAYHHGRCLYQRRRSSAPS
jgi:uncharacterized protein